MLTNSLDISTKQLRHLVAIQPHGLVFKPYIQPDGLVRLINDYLVFVCAHFVYRISKYYTNTPRMILPAALSGREEKRRAGVSQTLKAIENGFARFQS